MLPIFIRFGAERGRLASYLTLAAFFLLGFGVMNFLPDTGKDVIVSGLQNIPIAGILVGLVLLVVLAIFVSVSLSLRFIRKREF